MRIIMGVLMVLTVSGENERTIYGTLNGSILLQCNCSPNKTDLKWQKDQPIQTLVYNTYNGSSNFHGKYRGRAKISRVEKSSDCSLLLTNIRPEDQGKYKCIFRDPHYEFHNINLLISASYNVCQTSRIHGSKNTLECHVTGGYREAEIEWTMDEKILTNSTEATITHSDPTASNGFYSFWSKLEISKLNLTPEPKCGVKAKGILPNISYACEQTNNPNRITGVPEPQVMRFYKIIPIVLVLGISLVLWYRWRTHTGHGE